MAAVEVRAPASSANLGAGVDCLGVALTNYLTVRFEPADEQTLVFGDGFAAPVPAADNLVLRSAARIFEKAGASLPALRVSARTQIPMSRGMGSSASAIVAGVCGANALLGNRFDTAALLREAAAIEGHPDNVAPCLFGGVTAAMRDGDDVFVRRARFPDALRIVVCVPDFELSTKKARSVLPESVPLRTAAAQLSRACFLTASLFAGGLEHLDAASADALFTPARKPLIPGYDEVAGAARGAGALCAMISGAGPSIAAFARPEAAQAVAEAMDKAFAGCGIRSQARVLSADNEGAKVYRL